MYFTHCEKLDLPPVDAFLPLTIQAANPVKRFATGGRDEVEHNADGSLDLYIHREEPGSDKEVLVASPCERCARPENATLFADLSVLDRRWTSPPVLGQSSM